MATFVYETPFQTAGTSFGRNPPSHSLHGLSAIYPYLEVVNPQRQFSPDYQMETNDNSTDVADAATEEDKDLPIFEELIAEVIRGKSLSGVDNDSVHTTAPKDQVAGTEAELELGQGKAIFAAEVVSAIAARELLGESKGNPIILVDSEDEDEEDDDNGEQHTTHSKDSAQPARQPDHSQLSRLPSEAIANGRVIDSGSANSMNDPQKPVAVGHQAIGSRHVGGERSPPRMLHPARHQSLSPPEVNEEDENNTALLKAPASAGHVHDIFAEYEAKFGKGRMQQKTPEQKVQTLHSSSPSSLSGSNGEPEQCQLTGNLPVSGHSSTSLRSLDKRTVPDEPPHTQAVDKSRHPSVGPTPQPDTPYGKRSSPSVGDGPLPKRSCRRRVETRKAREARETSALLNSLEKEGLGHAYPRYCRGKDWEVDDLDDVRLAKDGSIRCVVRWKPSEVKFTALVGEPLQKRLEELFKTKYGVEGWESWQASQATRGGCRKDKGRDAQK